jgi:hypothetical protein
VVVIFTAVKLLSITSTTLALFFPFLSLNIYSSSAERAINHTAISILE